MKRIIALLIVSISGIMICLAQQGPNPIKPMLTKDKVWTIAELPGVTRVPVSTFSLKVWKDTLIQEETYSIIIQDWGKGEWDTIDYYDMYREKDGKVFREILYYDFTMEIGDTLVYSPENLVVLDSIVEQKMLDGELYRHYYLSYFHFGKYIYSPVWIEGLGSTSGIDSPIVPPSGGGGQYLLCVHENGVQVYQSPRYKWCSVYPMENLFSDKKTWTYGQIKHTNGIDDSTSFSYTIEGDTLVHVTEYGGSTNRVLKKMYRTDAPDLTNRVYAGGIFADNYFAYYLPPGEKSYYLLYDFSLFEGKTFVAKGGADTLVVDSLVSKPFAGKERLHWYMHSLVQPNQPPTLWIEGIGQYGDILKSTLGFDDENTETFLLCYSENGVQLYQNPAFDNCSLSTGVRQNPSMPEKLITLFLTNNGQINIQSLSGAKGAFFLLGFDGRRLARKKLDGYEIVEIIPPSTGLYLYRFESSDGRIQTGKVVAK
jgi:hypothetical protein